MADDPEKPLSDRLAETSAVLAEWAARSAAESAMLRERLEGMGYDVAGKSEDEITEVLRKPPTKAAAR